MNVRIALIILILGTQVLRAQVNGTYVPATTCANCASKDGSSSSVMNGSTNIATSYVRSTCGLNYVQSSLRLCQRLFGGGPQTSITQPATFSISGIPPCANILKAFLYVGMVGNGTTINANLTNPANTNSIFPMVIIGIDSTLCWNTRGTYSYRADVTSIISGNGGYIISGIPTSTVYGSDDPDGATLFIIYSDPTQLYTGNIVIADGCQTTFGPSSTPGGISSTISGFSVCGTPTLTNNFMLVADMQALDSVDICLNASQVTPNFFEPRAAQNIWNFISAPGSPVLPGQTTANYGIAYHSFDCVGMMMAGMYYRSACLTCPAAQLTLSASSTASCLATASVVVSGGVAPYTYTWTGTAQTTSAVTGLSAGTYTVRAVDANTCVTGFGSAVITINTPAPAISVNSVQPICKGYSVALSAGPALSYTWSPGTFLNSVSAPSVAATPTASTIYTVAYTNTLGCSGSQTIQVTVGFVQAFASPDQTVCAGQPLTLSMGTATGTVYNWTGPNSYVSNFGPQNPVIANTSISMMGIYNVSVVTAPGCTLTSSKNVTVLPVPSQTLAGNSPLCSGNTLIVTSASIGVLYAWSGPASYTANSQNFAIPNSGTTSAGTYSLATSLSNGCTVISTLAVVVHTNPIAAIAATTLVCQNAVLLLQGSADTPTDIVVYQWSGPNGFASATQVNSLTAQIVNAGVYQLTVTSSNGCQGTASTAVTVVTPQIFSSNNLSLCAGQSLLLTTGTMTGSTYYWNGPNSFTSAAQVPVISNTNQGMSGTYNASVTTNAGCLYTTSLGVNVVPVPSQSFTSNSPLCSGSTLSVTSVIIGQAYLWSGPANYTNNLQNLTIVNSGTASAGIYSLSTTF